ncbi:MAG: putative Ig domain-containing protein [Dehalococcoidia bacterium]|nr:putative Ig domain-containing protein [Dehalococcoidia bacterium]
MNGWCVHRLGFRLVCLAVIVLSPALAILSWSVPCRSDTSSTQKFFGYVFNSGSVVPCGYIITAIIGATIVGQTSTDSEGRYGYSPVFVVSGSEGQMVNFSVNGHPATQHAVFHTGESTQLNITAYGAPPYMPSASCSSCLSCSGTACSTSSYGISPVTLPNATLSYPYSVDMNARGGTPPYRWSILGGSLPDGLTLDSTLGVVRGVPTSEGVFHFTVRVDDNAANAFMLSTCIMVTIAAGTDLSELSQAARSAQTSAITARFMGKPDMVSYTGLKLDSARELASEDRRVRLKLETGTVMNLKGSTNIGAGRESNPPQDPGGSICLSSYSFTPAGAIFTPPATMTLKYDTPLPGGLDESDLYVAFWDGGQWIKLESQVNTVDDEVSASVAHFTIFAVRGQAQDETGASDGTAQPAQSGPPSDNLAFSDLNVKPGTAGLGENVTVTLRVSNKCDTQAEGDIVLEINGEDEVVRTVTLEAGKADTVSFIINKNASGLYTVEVAGLSASFEVSEGVDRKGGQRIPDFVIIIAVCLAGLLIAFVLLKDLFKRRAHKRSSKR